MRSLVPPIRPTRAAAGRAIAASARTDGVIGDVLAALVGDPDPAVFEAALDAAAGRVSPAVAAALRTHLVAPAQRRRALGALATAGPAAVGVVESVLDELPDEAVADVVTHVLGPCGGARAVVEHGLAPDTPSVVRRAAYATVLP